MEVDHQENDDEGEEGVVEPDNGNQFGLRGKCPLNVLQSFHCVHGMPPDILHDILEGKYLDRYIFWCH